MVYANLRNTTADTVKPSVSDHPKCKDLVVAYGRWAFTRIETQEASSKKRPGHIYFIEDNLLHAISKSRYVYFHVVTKVLRIVKVAPHSEQKD